MHIEQTQDKFVELRAQGWTLGHIATELNVSKRTLVDWNRHFAADIECMRALEKEALQEKFVASREEDLNRLTRLQKDVQDELANRCLKYIDTEKLFRLSVELRQQIQQICLANGSAEPKPRPGRNSQNGNGHDKGPAGNGKMAVDETRGPAPVAA